MPPDRPMRRASRRRPQSTASASSRPSRPDRSRPHSSTRRSPAPRDWRCCATGSRRFGADLRAYRAGVQPTRPLLTGDFGMASSTHWLATAAAMSVLERGGNAFDAAAAGGFVLQVVEPHLNGPGGEVPIVLWSERDRAVRVVCGQGVAPAAATIEAFDDLGVTEIPGTGPLAATVPGAFGGWLTMLERWGTWCLRDVLGYAISYARNGFPVIPGIGATLAAAAAMFRADWPTSAAAWLPGDRAALVGERLANPTLAATYERLVAEAESVGSNREAQISAAQAAWYSGFVAEAIGRFATGTRWRDSTGDVHGGLLTAADLADWQATVEAPATFDYGRYTVCKTRAWGQGPVFLAQLALLDGFDLGKLGHLSADYLHIAVECAKLAFADREAWYGDAPGVDEVHLALLDPEYVATRRGLVTDIANRELRPGELRGERPRVP